MLYKVTGAGHSVCVCVCVWGGGGGGCVGAWVVVGEGGQSSVVRGVREERGGGARTGGSSASWRKIT